MAIQPPKPTSLYQAEILASLTQTGVRVTSPGGKARAFCDIVGDKLGELETRQTVNLMQSLWPYATADSLDFLGSIRGVIRIPRQDAAASQSDSNFRFYVRNGTFGAINGGQNITVPAGVRIYTNDPSGPIYQTTSSVTLLAGANSQPVGVISLTDGSSGNAPENSFTKHSFTNYVDSRFGSLLVTNDFGVISGRDAESDDDYRFRISLSMQSRGGASEDDIRLAILLVPGVQDVVFKRLAGTYIAYIYGISPQVPSSLLQLAQAALDSRTAAPQSGLAVAPDLVGISLATTVKLVNGVTASDATSILATAAQAAGDYINNLPIGQSLIINEIGNRIRSSDSRIVDVGQPDRPLLNIFIWRSRADGSRFSRFLISNYGPAVGERLVVESIASAINLTLE